ncbi:hypothetical protein [Halotia branconii]|uniref:Uncharacterized protein n=1 Tax=Halotia branconii CENA392 TaxID=1539056 RepID=A0AAJ6NSS9_9CYAN|nr:hypothetical protein [Halotia branconii]WGV25942.1 hypothetical protein QI031_30270 [Halotia branconii CENA392]WGV25958.1 hypothetical protein QI031_00080 [Halotia branconii CENA392]
MQIKTISYKRIFNAGNYESKHLEMFAEVYEEDDIETETSHLMETVERKIREDASEQLKQELSELKKERRKLLEAIEQLQKEKDKLTGTEEPNPDEIPFDSSASLSNF